MSTNFGNDTDPDDRMAERLRDALTSEAAMVTPSDDGLQQIRSGIDERTQRPWWKHPATPALAAALVLGVMAGGIAVFAGGNNDDDNVVATQPSTSTTASESAQTEPSDPPATGTPTPIAVEGDVYVYYVMDDGQSPRLYREQRPNPGMDPVMAALTTMLTEPPLDPDYSSPWPNGTRLLDESVSGDTATVDVSKFPALGAQAEQVAVQQLVYTVTANDTSVKKVKLLVDGKAPQSGHDDWSTPVARAPMMDVQGWIWLLAPSEGAITSSPVAIKGYGSAFEATINWDVTKDGVKVAEGFTNGGSMGEFGDFSDTVELDPGTYEIRALEYSAEDGSPIHIDTKTFTVK
jgi:Immunoglobulin-like domain of bacterial spore germination/Sporulation and spore germination